MEPIISGGGVIVPPKNYMKEVQKVCNKYGVLLIVDEVVNGFGRLGEKFGFMNYDVKPDIVTMAKGLTSSYLPLSVTAIRKDLFEVLKKDGEYSSFRHINTFGGNPASCAVALKNMEIIEEEDLPNRANELGNRIMKELSQIRDYSNVGDVRGKGLLIGIELVADKETKEPANTEMIDNVIASCKKQGLIIGKNGDTVAGHGNVLILAPPLSMTDEDIEFIINVIKKSLSSI